MTTYDHAAEHLFAELEAHKVIAPFPGDVAPASLDDAYAIQDRVHRMRTTREGTTVEMACL